MKELKITLRKSLIGQQKKTKMIVDSLGFRKLNYTKIMKDTPQLRGALKKVIHLFEIEEVN